MAEVRSYHIHEYILDWVLYTEEEPILRSCTVGHNVISDHFPVLFYLNITKPRQQPAFRVSRNIRAMCRPDFTADIAASVAYLSEPIAAQFNEQLSGLLDRQSPVVRSKVPTRRPSPGYADVCEELRAAKRRRRREERRWLKSGLTTDKQIYTAAKRAVSKIVHEAKPKYLSSKITESKSSKQLYRVSNKFLGRAEAPPLLTVHPSDQLPDVFSEYFLNKMKQIRNDLDLQTSLSPIHGDPYTAAVFDAFQPVSEEHVRNVMLKSAPKTCSLDPMPTSLFVEC